MMTKSTKTTVRLRRSEANSKEPTYWSCWWILDRLRVHVYQHARGQLFLTNVTQNSTHPIAKTLYKAVLKLHWKRFKIYSYGTLQTNKYIIPYMIVVSECICCVPFWNLCHPETCFRLALCAVLKKVSFWNMFQIGAVKTLPYQGKTTEVF